MATKTESVLTMRPASIEDADLLGRWDTKPHVRAAVSNDGQKGFDLDWNTKLSSRAPGSDYFIAAVDGFAIGAMQIMDPAADETEYWGAVAPNLRALDI